MADIWHLTEIDWLAELPADSARKLHAAASVLTFDRGETVFKPVPEPAYVFILKSGLVRIYRANQHGKQVTLGYIQPGEVFGELAALTHKPRESYAVAEEQSTVIKVERQVFVDAIQSRPSIVFSVAAEVGDRFKQIESRVEDLVFRSARSRVARIILQLAAEFRTKAANHLRIGIRLSQSEIATLAGTSRPTVSIVLRDFEDEGLLSRAGGQILVKDREHLQEEADRIG